MYANFGVMLAIISFPKLLKSDLVLSLLEEFAPTQNLVIFVNYLIIKYVLEY